MQEKYGKDKTETTEALAAGVGAATAQHGPAHPLPEPGRRVPSPIQATRALWGNWWTPRLREGKNKMLLEHLGFLDGKKPLKRGWGLFKVQRSPPGGAGKV